MREEVLSYIISNSNLQHGIEVEIQNRLNDGSLKKGRVSLASHFGFPPANAVRPSSFDDPIGDRKWWSRFPSWGTVVSVRAARSLALPMYQIVCKGHLDDQTLAKESLSIVDDWLACPSKSVEERARSIEDPHDLDEEWMAENRPYLNFTALMGCLNASVTSISPCAIWDVQDLYAECFERPQGVSFSPPFNRPGVAPTAVDLVSLQIIPWCLDLYDPLKV